ncbi:c-type cytochrome [Aestuariirhabdus sp. LZHN29]|uniref:c-type cytochrome n=1 Tax=Aestuariirhabdus sp. LZHN29 TaxID=3417462 RepID=UPI003CE9BC1A
MKVRLIVLRAASIMLVLAMPVQAADVFKGQRLYAQECERCHGSDGSGVMAGGVDFSLGDGLRVSNKRLHDHIDRGKGGCPSFFGILESEEILDVVAYLRTLY